MATSVYFILPQNIPLTVGMLLEFKGQRSVYCATCRRQRFVRDFVEGEACSFCGGHELYGDKRQHRALRPRRPPVSPTVVHRTITAIDHESRVVTYSGGGHQPFGGGDIFRGGYPH